MEGDGIQVNQAPSLGTDGGIDTINQECISSSVQRYPLRASSSTARLQSPFAIPLMEFVSDRQDLSSVEKVQIIESNVLDLCNFFSTASARECGKNMNVASNANIDFEDLGARSIRILGLYGQKESLIQVVREWNLAPLLLDKMEARTLKTGLFACLSASHILCLIYWDARETVVESSRKDMSCNFVRYLIDLCDTVLVCLDGRMMEASTIPQGVGNPSASRKQRVQRIKVSACKETKTDLDLSEGFRINEIRQSLAHVRLSQGVHRCVVLNGVLHKDLKAKVIQLDVSGSPAEIKAWIDDRLQDSYLDCTRLPNEQFLILLDILEKQTELKQYKKEKEGFKVKIEKIKRRQSSLDADLMTIRRDMQSIMGEVVYFLLKRNSPWGWGLVKNNNLVHTESQQNPLLTFEAEVCNAFLGDNKNSPRLLFAGSQFEVLSDTALSSKEFPCSTSGQVCLIKNLRGSDADAQYGPLYYGQDFVFCLKNDSENEDSKLMIGAFTLTDSSTQQMGSPVVLHGYTRVKFAMGEAIEDRAPKIVEVKYYGGGDLGCETWLRGACKIQCRCLHTNAAALSYLMHELNLTKPDSKTLTELLTRPLEEWHLDTRLPKETATKLKAFKVQYSNRNYTVNEVVAKLCTSVYYVDLKNWRDELDALIKSKIYLNLRDTRLKQLKKEIEITAQEWDSRREVLLSGMKSQVFNSKIEGDKKKHYKLEKCEWKNGIKEQFGFKTLKLSFYPEHLDTHTFTWSATEFVPRKVDLDAALMASSSSSPTQALKPVPCASSELTSFDSNSRRLIDAFTLKDGQVLLLESIIGEASLCLYHMKLGEPSSKILIKSFKRGHDLWAFEEASRILALYDKNLSCIKCFRFDDKYRETTLIGEVKLSTDIIWIGLVPGKREILLVDDKKMLISCEFSPDRNIVRNWGTILAAQLIKAFVTPDALFFVVICALTDTGNGRELMKETGKDSPGEMFAIVYSRDDSLTELKRLPLGLLTDRNIQDLHVVCKLFGPQLHIVILSSVIHGYELMSYLVKISSPQQKFQLHVINPNAEASAAVRDDVVPCNDSLAALNYIFHAFDKYAVNSPLCPEHRTLTLIFLLCPSCHGWEDVVAKRNCKSHMQFFIQSLQRKGKVLEELDLKLIFKPLMGDRAPEEFFPAQKQIISDWIQKLLCLIPIQVARAENNMLRLMVDGLEIPSNVEFSDSVSLAGVLHFGTYDLLLESWKGKIKVISSMGKQSSGKSYLLNHLAGSLFDVSGGRCTDGVWMTLRWDSECMYVLLDFEGLGSFERSDQEDMLLSILSAAMSNLTIFNKKDFHMDKETEAIFQRFQHGVKLVKADDKLFKGQFCIAVKDVDSSDVEDLKAEFLEKLYRICNRASENFLVRMYDGQIFIHAFSPFQQQEYNLDIGMLATIILEIDGHYATSRRFLRDFKLVLSQISVKDWSPMNSRRIMMRIFILRNHLDSAITFGQCNDGQCNDGQMLAVLETDESIVDSPIQWESETCSSFQLKDSGLELTVSGTGKGMSSMDDIVESLRAKFQAVIQRDDYEGAWHVPFQRFLNLLIERRQKRVIEWLVANTKEFNEDDDVQQLTVEARTRVAELKDKVLLCECRCSKCFLTCVLLKGHHSHHSCLGTHTCSQECTFCREEQSMRSSAFTELKLMECAEAAGHSGIHDCNKRMHSCEQTCIKYEHSANCHKKCSLRVNHEGEHICKTPQHMCREKCSLPGCENTCNTPFESEHQQHECSEKFCLVQCTMPGCTRQCATQDHFHRLEDNAQHFCSSEHPCTAKCEVPGVCNVVTEIVKQTRVFHGQRGDFEYDFQSMQSEIRKGCCLMIPAFTREHSGSHLHSINTNVIHYCDVRCPDCEYFCQRPFGHDGFHHTAHGNMKKSRFVADTENIDIQGRKYVRGESGEAEMCIMHCRARGRGHTHLIPCPERGDGDGICREKVYDGAKHVTTEKQEDLNVKIPFDQMTHAAYWDYIGFEDPCDEYERKTFALCDHYCPSEEHDDGIIQKSYCTEKLWHDPVPTDACRRSTGGYVSKDGHRFTCTHTMTNPHNVIFVVDRSYSMRSNDIKPRSKMFPQNRLGCVYESMQAFINLRKQELKCGSLQKMDTISVVLFDSCGEVLVELEPMSMCMINELPSKNKRHTIYSSGLEKAELILDKSREKPEFCTKTPVIIFLSDGENNGGKDPVSKVRELRSKNPDLVVHTIMYGNASSGRILKDMASAGGGDYNLTLTALELTESFEHFAMSLQPKLVSLCSL